MQFSSQELKTEPHEYTTVLLYARLRRLSCLAWFGVYVEGQMRFRQSAVLS